MSLSRPVVMMRKRRRRKKKKKRSSRSSRRRSPPPARQPTRPHKRRPRRGLVARGGLVVLGTATGAEGDGAAVAVAVATTDVTVVATIGPEAVIAGTVAVEATADIAITTAVE